MHLFVTEYYGTLPYYVTETLLDILWSLICATIIAIISYYLTNQPRQTDRFIAYLLVWYLIILIMNAYGHVITLLFYPYSIICLIIALFGSALSITLTNFFVLKSDQDIPYSYMSDILFEMRMHNALVLTLYSLDRCPDHTLSLKLESYNINRTHSLFWQILIMIINLVFFEILCLLMLYKTYFSMIIFNLAKRFYMHNYEQNINMVQPGKYLPNMIQENVNGGNLSFDNVHVKDNDTLMVKERILNIAWTNLTIKGKNIFKEKIILNDINGFVEFRTMMALMGPSGAGKSTLLKTLMGMNRNLMKKESKIYCNKDIALKSCFITQDVRQHIMIGLTVEQSISYASKLKNLDNNGNNICNRKDIIDVLMRDFSIDDIRDVSIGKCSSGQQKRCVLAMELCAQQKPIVVCVDEPTSGLDSHSALIVR